MLYSPSSGRECELETTSPYFAAKNVAGSLLRDRTLRVNEQDKLENDSSAHNSDFTFIIGIFFVS